MRLIATHFALIKSRAWKSGTTAVTRHSMLPSLIAKLFSRKKSRLIIWSLLVRVCSFMASPNRTLLAKNLHVKDATLLGSSPRSYRIRMNLQLKSEQSQSPLKRVVNFGLDLDHVDILTKERLRCTEIQMIWKTSQSLGKSFCGAVTVQHVSFMVKRRKLGRSLKSTLLKATLQSTLETLSFLVQRMGYSFIDLGPFSNVSE